MYVCTFYVCDSMYITVCTCVSWVHMYACVLCVCCVHICTCVLCVYMDTTCVLLCALCLYVCVT